MCECARNAFAHPLTAQPPLFGDRTWVDGPTVRTIGQMGNSQTVRTAAISPDSPGITEHISEINRARVLGTNPRAGFLELGAF